MVGRVDGTSGRVCTVLSCSFWERPSVRGPEDRGLYPVGPSVLKVDVETPTPGPTGPVPVDGGGTRRESVVHRGPGRWMVRGLVSRDDGGRTVMRRGLEVVVDGTDVSWAPRTCVRRPSYTGVGRSMFGPWSWLGPTVAGGPLQTPTSVLSSPSVRRTTVHQVVERCKFWDPGG